MGIEPALGIFQETTVADTRFLADFNRKAKLNSYDKQVNFLFISRILKAKGIYIAIDAFNECQQSHSERSMSLYIAGEGEELSSAKAYVKRLKINNVHFLGNIQGEEKKDVLHQCHISKTKHVDCSIGTLKYLLGLLLCMILSVLMITAILLS